MCLCVQLTFASYNIRKAIGRDRRRNPERILTVLGEIDADVVALQEVDRRVGKRASALPLSMILEHTSYRPVQLATKPQSLGWHGNALLVKQHLDILDAGPVPLPTLEPRGAVHVDLAYGSRRLRVVGMHLDLSGLRRRKQVRTILAHLSGQTEDLPTVLLGDFNQWTAQSGCLREFGQGWQLLSPGRSYPARSPVARLDRVIASPEWQIVRTGVHRSALSARGSDHLPIWAELSLPKKQAAA